MNEYDEYPSPTALDRALARARELLPDGSLELWSVSTWAEKQLVSETGERISFDDRPWLRAIYDDQQPHVVARKATQIGMTTCAVAKALHQVVQHGKTAIYTLPTEKDAQDFVAGRLDPIIDNSPQVRALLE